MRPGRPRRPGGRRSHGQFLVGQELREKRRQRAISNVPSPCRGIAGNAAPRPSRPALPPSLPRSERSTAVPAARSSCPRPSRPCAASPLSRGSCPAPRPAARAKLAIAESPLGRAFSGRARRALMHLSADLRGSPFPGQAYPAAFVTGLPGAVQRGEADPEFGGMAVEVAFHGPPRPTRLPVGAASRRIPGPNQFVGEPRRFNDALQARQFPALQLGGPAHGTKASTPESRHGSFTGFVRRSARRHDPTC